MSAVDNVVLGMGSRSEHSVDFEEIGTEPEWSALCEPVAPHLYHPRMRNCPNASSAGMRGPGTYSSYLTQSRSSVNFGAPPPLQRIPPSIGSHGASVPLSPQAATTSSPPVIKEQVRSGFFTSFGISKTRDGRKTSSTASASSGLSPAQRTVDSTTGDSTQKSPRTPTVEERSPGTSLADDGEETDSAERVKTKLLAVWNNVKYGWTVRLKTNFSRDSAIWFLGQVYHRKLSDSVSDGDGPGLAYGIDGFRQDFVSRVWFTYRREFPTLAGSSYTSDCGWGCMLRSGQMLLAQGLISHFLGRSWRWQVDQFGLERIHRMIVRWFGDLPNESSPFSLHQLVTIGESSGKKAGDWYGPASVAYILKQCMEVSSKSVPDLQKVCVYVAQDCTVFKYDVMRLCTGRVWQQGGENCDDGEASPNDIWKGVIILVPVRLGGEVLNPIYFQRVQAILSNEFCIGIIGGRPKHSLYFVGWQDDKLIHLDPHYCQEAVDVRLEDFPLQTFHCTSPRKLSFTRMDPSCTIGFYCRTKEELLKLFASCSEVDYPVFVVSDGSSDQAPYDLVQSLSCDQLYFSGSTASDGREPSMDSDDYSEEFVFL